MSKTFTVSDYHAWHTNICGPKLSRWDKGYRDFNSLEEMYDTIVNNTNRTVGTMDRLIFCGDSIFGKDKMESFRKLWNDIDCKNITYIAGNHDDFLFKGNNLIEAEKIVGKIRHLHSETLNGYNFHFSHYRPIEIGLIFDSSMIQVFGHEHCNKPDDQTTLTIDVSFESEWYGHKKYHPYNIEEIIDIMKTRKVTKWSKRT